MRSRGYARDRNGARAGRWATMPRCTMSGPAAIRPRFRTERSMIAPEVVLVLPGVGWAIARDLRGCPRAAATGRDTTEIERLRTSIWRISESEERYRALVEATTDVIVQRDAQGRITFANDGLRASLRCGAPDVARLDGRTRDPGAGSPPAASRRRHPRGDAGPPRRRHSTLVLLHRDALSPASAVARNGSGRAPTSPSGSSPPAPSMKRSIAPRRPMSPSRASSPP